MPLTKTENHAIPIRQAAVSMPVGSLGSFCTLSVTIFLGESQHWGRISYFLTAKLIALIGQLSTHWRENTTAAELTCPFFSVL